MNSHYNTLQLPESISVLSIFNKIIEDTTVDMMRWDEGLLKLCDVVDNLTKGLAGIGEHKISNAGLSVSIPDRIYSEAVRTSESDSDEEEGGEGLKKGFKTASNFVKIAKNGLEVFEKFHELPEVLGKAKKGIGILDDVMGTIGGVGEAFEGAGILDSLAAITEVIAGEAGIVAALSNPVGLVIGGAALVGGYVYSKVEEHQKEEHKKEVNREREERSLATFRMTSKEADSYILSTPTKPKFITPPEKKWEVKYDPFGEQTKFKKADEMQFHNFNVKPATDNVNHVYADRRIPVYQPKAYVPPPNFIEKSQPLVWHLENVGREKGIDAFNNEVYGVSRDKAKYGLNDNEMQLAVRQARTEIVNDANVGKEVVNGKRGKAGGRMDEYETGGCRQLIINLNRPMIEHFTINTKDTKQGVNEFKHKVEEVLLEILNSVNVN